jgi:predicted PolB exonuclease-like 3'-5' exonuclease
MWWDILKELDHSFTFVGFNSIGFDAYFLLTRSMYHRILPTNKNFANLKMYQSHPHYDIMQHLGNWRWENIVSLGAACEFFGLPNPKAGEVSGKSVHEAWKKGNLKGIAKYVMDDVHATKNLYDVTRNYLKT